jgi:hypothetical protein
MGVTFKRKRRNPDYRVQELKRFLGSCELTYFNDGSNGVALKGSNWKTPFKNKKTGEEVTTVLIKLIVISETLTNPGMPDTPSYSEEHTESDSHSEPKDETPKGHLFILGNEYDLEKDLEPTTPASFQNEVQMQRDINALTDSVCPSILYSTIHSVAELNRMFARRVVATMADVQIGVVLMEIIEPAESFFSVKKYSPVARVNHLLTAARAKFLYLAQLGFNHGDLHTSNILVSGDDVFLIDFGRTSRITSNLAAIRASIAERDYVQALRLLIMTRDNKFSATNLLATTNDSGDQLLKLDKFMRLPAGALDEFKKNLVLCKRNLWANSSVVNAAIRNLNQEIKQFYCATSSSGRRTIEPVRYVKTKCDGFIKFFGHFGWVFNDEPHLSLTEAQKTGISEVMERLHGAPQEKSASEYGSSSQETKKARKGGRCRRFN